MSFPCLSCGLCCQNISKEILPELYTGSSTCQHFNKKSLECNIYNERPLICRIDDSWKKSYSNQMSKKDFYLINMSACIEMSKKSGMSVLSLKLKNEYQKISQEKMLL